MLEEGPSKLSDALGAILGLEDLTFAADTLKEARTQRSRIHKGVRDKLSQLRALLADHDDPRAAVCEKALKGTKWKLESQICTLSDLRSSFQYSKFPMTSEPVVQLPAGAGRGF